MKRVFQIILMGSLLFTACSTDDDEINGGPAVSDEKLLVEMIQLAKTNSINRNDLDWVVLEESVFRSLNDGTLNGAILQLLKELGDNHSSYRSPAGRVAFYSELNCTGNFSISNLKNDSTGYVAVNGFSGTSDQAKALAESIQANIKEQDTEKIKGWIVDLSDNSGGNMWPMLAGLGPILGDGVLGHFTNPNGSNTPWGYDTNGSYLGPVSRKIVSVTEPYQIMNTEAKVAVIVDAPTASSGEATLIAFIGRSNTLIIGMPSCGLSTANQSFDLSNGGSFNLTVSTMADRNMTAYGSQVNPEIQLNDPTAIGTEIRKWMDE